MLSTISLPSDSVMYYMCYFGKNVDEASLLLVGDGINASIDLSKPIPMSQNLPDRIYVTADCFQRPAPYTHSGLK